MTDREIMQQALNALEYHTMQTRPIRPTDKAIEALRQALAQPEQEPVKCTCGYAIGHPLVSKCICTPPKPWVGLTDDDHKDFANRTKLLPILAKTLAEFIEAKLKEKNYNVG